MRGCKRTVFMHRQLMNAGPELEVHHKNHNSLDNRRSNLILSTPSDHALAHALDRISRLNDHDQASVTSFLARCGITALCRRPSTTS